MATLLAAAFSDYLLVAVHKASLCQIYLGMKDVFLLLCQTHPLRTPTVKVGFFLKQTGGRRGWQTSWRAIVDN